MSAGAAGPGGAGTRRRRHELDLLRVVACLMVVMVHTLGTEEWSRGDPASSTWGQLNALASMQRACVPLFFMISGAVLLGRPSLDRARLMRHNIVQLVVLYVVWAGVYAVAVALVVGGVDGAGDLALRVLLGYSHLWYLPAMAVAYLVLPVAHAAIHDGRLPVGWLLGAAAVLALSWRLIALAPWDGPGWDAAADKLDPTQALYVLYIVLGRWLDRRSFSHRAGAGAAVAFCAVSALGAVANRWYALHVVHGPSGLLYGYFTPLTVVQAGLLFVVALSLRGWEPRRPRLLAALSACTLGIYLVHPLIQMLLGRVGLDATIAPPLVGAPAMCLLTASLALAVTRAGRRVPLVRRVL